MAAASPVTALCSVCQKQISHVYLENHMRRHTHVRPYSCAVCNKGFASQRELKEHAEIHDQNRRFYQCNHCDKKLYSKRGMSYHLKSHSEHRGKSKCPTCGIFSKNMSIHERTHLKPFFCQYCPKRFSAKVSWLVHELWHRGEAPFQCQHCTKSFRKKYNLKQHEKIHLAQNERIFFKCSICSKSYSTAFYLRRHMNEVHSDNSKQSYNCHLCTKKYSSFRSLKNHVARHLAKIRCELIEADREDETEELIASAAIPLQQQPPCNLTAAGTKLDEKRVVGSHLTLKDCFIRLKRVAYLETAIKKGHKSVRIHHYPKGSKFLRYTPVP